MAAIRSKKEKQKERQKALEALRKELAAEIVAQLPPQMQGDVPRGREKTSPSGVKVHDDQEAKRVIEAILFTASRPVTNAEIKRALDGYQTSKIDHLVRELQTEIGRASCRERG